MGRHRDTPACSFAWDDARPRGSPLMHPLMQPRGRNRRERRARRGEAQ
ncbi:hypothetical protein BRPE64_ACDS03760 [Caballeronia insecticola]|uniref:Uncharacterized protein n=1 Tax=Caballeronia insecticola TaxID=758793 RepID=R4WMM7_9BURK|nr:hypothetical protein BRPE64_ACDS03760 [Caballeronia insecticola]